MPRHRNKRQSCQASSSNTNNKELNPNDTAFFEALMSDPVKRELVLQLLSQEKETIAEYKKNANSFHKNAIASPLKRVKKKAACESPTALMRRRALEKQIQENRRTPSDKVSENSNRSTSRMSEDSKALSPSPIPFENLLKGVIAYVEIRSKDTDRSAGAKALMLSMGATVRDKFTSDVTHVVFKDASFTTYQKAKLMKVHMVSVLWLEAVRRSRTRVPEKNYPALGTEIFDNDISNICSQLQREYEDVVREDVRRSLAMGTPLPSTKSILSGSNRRRTIMTPFSSSHFIEKFRFSQELPSSQDKEVDNIISNKMLSTVFENNATPSGSSSVLASPSPDITSDESNCGVVNGDLTSSSKRNTVILETPDYLHDKNILRSVENLLPSKMTETRLTLSDMLITPVREKSSSISDNSKSLIGGDITKSSSSKKVKVITDVLISRNSSDKENVPKKNSDVRLSSDKSTNISSENDLCNNSKGKTEISKNSSGTNMSSLRVSSTNSLKSKNESHKEQTLDVISTFLEKPSDSSVDNLSRNTRGSFQASKDDTGKDSSRINMSGSRASASLKRSNSNSSSRRKKTKTNNSSGSKNNSKNSTHTSMSSLHITADSSISVKHSRSKDDNIDFNNDISTTMSLLQLSDGSKQESPKKAELAVESSSADLISIKNDVADKILSSDSSKLVRNEKSTVLDDSFVTRRSRRQLFPNNIKGSDQSELSLKQNGMREVSNSENKSNTKEISDSSSDSCQSSTQKSEKKLRKLYNPNESPHIRPSQTDEEQRRVKRKHAKKKLPNGFLDPNSLKCMPVVLLPRGKKDISKQKMDLDLSSSEDDVTPEKTKQKKKTSAGKSRKGQKRNSSADEQKKLAEEFVLEKKVRKTSNRFKTDDENKTNDDIKNVQSDNSKTPIKKGKSRRDTKPYAASATKAPRSSQRAVKVRNNASLPFAAIETRRSSLEFQTPSMLSTTKKKMKTNLKLSSIVCTKLHKDDYMVFNQIVRKLGKFVVEDEVSDRTTHLVAGESKRTINMLRAIARGCWILKHEWLLSSLEHGKWLPEEDYEITDFSPAVQQCRLQRQAFGSSYSMDVFEGCGSIYIAKSSIPRCSDLQELVSLCKGTVTTILRNAKIVVGEFFASKDVTCVTELWILDCITYNKRKSLKKYIIKASSTS